jgi:hypothetical protein
MRYKDHKLIIDSIGPLYVVRRKFIN